MRPQPVRITQEEPEKHTQREDSTIDTTDQGEVPREVTTNTACAHDVAAFCQNEANIVAMLREAPDVVEPRKIVSAMQIVRLCMATHASVLSADCVSTLSAWLSASPTMIASVPAKRFEMLHGEGVDDDSSMEIDIHYSRHHNGAGHALRSGGALAANHVQTSGPPFDLTGVLSHPITWIFFVLFFAIGLYVTVSRTATFLRRRREERRIESKLYMPVN